MFTSSFCIEIWENSNFRRILKYQIRRDHLTFDSGVGDFEKKSLKKVISCKKTSSRKMLCTKPLQKKIHILYREKDIVHTPLLKKMS